jgi:F0F1-type ATP synthase epsilon subunit
MPQHAVADYHLSLVSGGFATVHPNNMLTINAVEAAPIEDFSAEVSLVP